MWIDQFIQHPFILIVALITHRVMLDSSPWLHRSSEKDLLNKYNECLKCKLIVLLILVHFNEGNKLSLCLKMNV